jgi:hypothetical protein
MDEMGLSGNASDYFHINTLSGEAPTFSKDYGYQIIDRITGEIVNQVFNAYAAKSTAEVVAKQALAEIADDYGMENWQEHYDLIITQGTPKGYVSTLSD